MVYYATNSLKAKDAFRLRKKYKETLFSDFVPNPIDFYYENPMYGKIDRDMNAVLPLVDQKELTATLTYFPDSLVLAPTFVVRAFEDFKRAFDRVISQSRGVAPRGLSDLSVKQAFINFDSLYGDYKSGLRSSLINGFLREREKEIYNFNDFGSLGIVICFRIYIIIISS